MTGNLATKMASNSYFSMHDMHAYYGEKKSKKSKKK